MTGNGLQVWVMKVSAILFIYRYMLVESGNSWKKMLIGTNKERK